MFIHGRDSAHDLRTQCNCPSWPTLLLMLHEWSVSHGMTKQVSSGMLLPQAHPPQWSTISGKRKAAWVQNGSHCMLFPSLLYMYNQELNEIPKPWSPLNYTLYIGSLDLIVMWYCKVIHERVPNFVLPVSTHCKILDRQTVYLTIKHNCVASRQGKGVIFVQRSKFSFSWKCNSRHSLQISMKHQQN